MARLLIIIALVCGLLRLSAAEADWSQVDQLIEQVNPARNIDARDESAFTGAPVSDIGRDIKSGFWFSMLIFLPFLLIPQVLLLYAIIAFRDRGDGRRAASWVTNHKLEIFWTAVPVLALVIVAIPMVDLLYRQEAPPKPAAGDEQPMLVEVTGKQYSWLYDYPDYGISDLGTYFVDLSAYGIEPSRPITLQETAAFPVDRISNLTFTSQDVNHAWGVQAFGIRKDCIKDRQNWAWFRPDQTGFYEGQCYEPCGADHGAMLLSAAVLAPEDFDRWVSVHLFRDEALRVIRTINSRNEVAAADEPAAAEQAAADEPPTDEPPADPRAERLAALRDYLLEDAKQGDERLFALRFWLAYDGAVKAELLRNNQLSSLAEQVLADDAALRAELDALIGQGLARPAVAGEGEGA